MKNSPSVEEQREIHRRMILTRRLEEILGVMAKEGKTRGPLHRCDGQEAVGVASCMALNTSDYVCTTHRGHHVYVGKGMEPRRIVAEIMGRETGYCGGRGGHMLLGDASIGMIGGNAIVGAGIPAAAGMALSIQVLKQDRVAMAVFGDGAAQTGIAHEAMNMAGLWKLPVIFLLENNQYGLTVRQEVQSPVEDLFIRAAGYGMPGLKIDGNDAVAVYRAVAEASERARRGEGATLIEAKTYRMQGFSTSDMGGYQSDEEMAPWRERDPILVSAKALGALIGDKAVSDIASEAETDIQAAFDLALSDPFPTFEFHRPSGAYAEI
ncbi:thiamine pyrophosphate-dependent dehydrogenase E1 component subunit alpha [Hoeflea alexandrii]|uniref:thiamine pyrophosphate-dependent dehydrogenase E1 component subunit alpha n=1 Tax=Hoeflea alexandrii TaxID=288436 RepID=UPI0022AFFADB|nr:thiamine pyrophosphate-dependent dehydrogenase E1 component subunit alpha [Hoeflea alexandrii]MCZ4291632.1 thiamine pyrophosphate-dependent dehydrogenase E1 component subunit alpha [Hoeflea alexandrii]